MHAGTLDQRVTIQRLTSGVDSIGQPSTTWQTHVETWASVRVLSGLAMLKAGADTSITKASIRVRYRSDITPAMRVVHRGATYQIDAVLPDAGMVHLDLTVKAVT